MKWFSSDWHLGHANVIRFSDRPFKSVEEMNKEIIRRMFAPMKKGDDLYLLGDLSWSEEGYEMIFAEADRKGVNIHWILGNHDQKEYRKYRNRVKSITDYREIKVQGHSVTLCHYPMLTWNKSHFDAWMLFGHHHTSGHGDSKIKELTKGKMLNVNCEFNDYKPYSENDIIRIMESRPHNWDFIQK